MLYFIPTPIGNLGDITHRAIEVLGQVDLIACEDTRHSSRLLQHFNIKKPLVALHDHNEAAKAAELIKLAQQGKNLGIISDAGMPCISDPGYRLMQAAIAAHIEYTVLPGPSAVLTALVGSGFPLHSFAFHGFLPVKKGKRLKILKSATEQDFTTVFFESPHRISSTLELLAQSYESHSVCVARELTKKFETYHRGTAKEVCEYFSQYKAKGEIVILIAPKDY